MRVYYHQSDYISHRKAGQDYKNCLRALGHTLAEAPEQADLAILHDEPLYYPQILEAQPALRRIPLIAYCVWETDSLPGAYIDPLCCMQGIWTCSEYSRQALARYFPHVKTLPHVVARPHPTAQDLEGMRERLSLPPYGAPPGTKGKEKYLFYTITDSVNPRKNLPALLKTFCALFPRLNPDVYLVIKQYRHCLNFSGLPNVIGLDGDLSEGEIAALHALGDCYVSAHRAEAWGLPLGEAMALGRPVIATGYSGNMEFMNAQNSLPVRYKQVNITPQDAQRLPLLHTGMHWAEIDAEHLGACLQRLAGRPAPADIVRNAAQISNIYSSEAVGKIMGNLLQEWE